MCTKNVSRHLRPAWDRGMRCLARVALAMCMLLVLGARPANALPSIHYWLSDDGNPGRTYGTDFKSIDEGHGWACRVYGDPANHEAVVYNYDQAIGTSEPTLTLPHAVEYEGQTYKVVGLVAYNDAVGRDDLSESNLGSGSNVHHLVIPNSVRFIGKCAFNGYEQLESVTFEEGIQLDEVEMGAFADCVSLTQIEFPGSVSHIDKAVLAGCTALESVTFPSGGEVDVQVFGNSDFGIYYGASGDTVGCESVIGGNIDLSCPALKSIYNAPAILFFETAPQQLQTVSYRPGLSEVWGLENASYNDFDSLTNVTLPEGITRVTGFSDCHNLATINLPSSLVCIGGFAGCTNLDPSLTPPASVEVIESGAFEGCHQLFAGMKALPANVKYVGDGAFSGCTNLKADIVHPGYLSGQYNNSGVRSVTFKRSGQLDSRIYNLVCDEDGYLDGYDEAGNFDNGTIASSYDLSQGYGNSLFQGCTNLQSITVQGGSRDSIWSEDGVLYKAEYKSMWSGYQEYGHGTNCLVKYPAGKSGGSYTIPSTARSVAPFAFADCTFTDIHVPVTVEKLLKDWKYNTDADITALDNMASTPTIYYVANSYVEDSLTLDRYYYASLGYEGPVAAEAGPTVAVTYDLAGGTNAAGNPTSIVGGSSATLANPVRAGYDFAGWVREGSDTVLAGGKLTPEYEELANRSVTVRATWTPEKKQQTITASNKTVKMGKTVALGAKTDGGGKLSYQSKNTSIATVSASGVVTPKKVGTVTIAITAAATDTHKEGTKSVTVKVTKGASPLKAKAVKGSVVVPLAKVNKAKVVLASNVKVTKKAPSAPTYANVSTNKVAKKFTVNTKTGKVTVPKGTKKGTYPVKVKLSAKGNANYNAGSVTVSYKVVVK